MASFGSLDFDDALPPVGSVTSSTALAIRNSTIIAHRLSIYLPQLLLPSRDPHKLIMEINSHVAEFRELLIFIGQSRDSQELREKIRRLRRCCVDACKHTAHLITPQPRHCQGRPKEQLHLSLLYHLMQMFCRDLIRSYRLIQLVPYDMKEYNTPSRTAPSNLGNVISQILLCKQINPDFQQEELCSISKDAEEVNELLAELQQHLSNSEATNESDSDTDLPHSSDGNLTSLSSSSAWYTCQLGRSCWHRSRSLCCCIKSFPAN